MQLHIARPGRLADPVNYCQLLEIEQNYPDLQLLVAHLGRAYANEDVGHALEYLKHTEKTVWDFTANTNDWVIEQVLQHFGPERLIYGSDFPVFRMRARRVVENGVYVNEIPQGLFPPEAIHGDVHMREIGGQGFGPACSTASSTNCFTPSRPSDGRSMAMRLMFSLPNPFGATVSFSRSPGTIS